MSENFEGGVSVVLPVKIADLWQLDLAKFCIASMRQRTAIPFELVIAQRGGRELESLADVFVPCESIGNYVLDWNRGADAATGSMLVHTGIDVIVGENWLESMMECFVKHADCGVSTTSVAEPSHMIGTPTPQPLITESFYGALMLFGARWRLDEAYRDQMSDYDLCQRIYRDGLRSYRNNASIAWHAKLEHNLDPVKKQERFVAGVRLFKERWTGSPWIISRLITRGSVKYGDEDQW